MHDMTPPTIVEAAADANALFTALLTDAGSAYVPPAWDILDDFAIPAGPALPDYPAIVATTVADLTTGVVGGEGVFDKLMDAMNAHLEAQCAKGRISGADYAKVYIASVQTMMQMGTQFLLEKDRKHWETLQAQATLRLALAQEARANADIQLARSQLIKSRTEFELLNFQLRTQMNEYAATKINLLTGYQSVVNATLQGSLTDEQINLVKQDVLLRGKDIEKVTADIAVRGVDLTVRNKDLDVMTAQIANTTANTNISIKQLEILDTDLLIKNSQLKLAGVTYETARAQVYETMEDGLTPFGGLVALDKILKEAQAETAQEQLDTIRANTKDTLKSGGPIAGIVAVDKRIKLAQESLTLEQAEAARAQTWDTHMDGITIISGLVAKEKMLKDAQGKYVLEQYESQRGQTRGTLSTGEAVAGMIGTQTALYEQQIVSYKRDGENKAIKMMLDSWIARKTIDEGVAVPAEIDTPAINAAMATYTTNLAL